MSSETTLAIGKKLVEYCQQNNTAACLNELYAEDAVSVEAMAMPGADSAETAGLEGIRGKHAWWDANFKVHSASVDGPFPHGDDRFGVIFEMDAENVENGERSAMKELAIYSVADGKIVREEFFYGS